MTTEAKAKQKFRQTAKWKKFRNYIKKRQNSIDIITQKKLYKGFQVHHLDLNPEHYQNLEDDMSFIGINRKSHEVVHWLWQYYETDPLVIKRLEKVLQMMKKINN